MKYAILIRKSGTKTKLVLEWYGNYLKFTQHPDLNQRLLSTGDKILVEASPYDLVLGVGLGVKDDKILNPSNWKGLNLLGKVLMSVRAIMLFEKK